MMIKTPKFWLEKNMISLALWPFSLIYRVLFFCSHRFKAAKKVKLPIICVGNLIAGGSGKTPVALAFGEILREIGAEFAYLSRGYLSKTQKIQEVDNLIDCAKNVGDEPLLLSFLAPTFVAKNRLEGAEFIALKEKYQAIILDDGMQNATLHKDFLAMVVDGKIKFGNKMQIPAGPLRQSIEGGVKAADLVVVVGKIDDELRQILQGKKYVEAEILPCNIEDFKGQKLFAFCGLAYPEKFFSYLRELNLELVGFKSFMDHYSYSDSDLQKLLKMAQNKGAKLVTTKKDWVKFSQEFKEKIAFLDIKLQFSDKKMVKELLKTVITTK